MAQVYKVLSQTNPSAATLTDSYTVPAATSAVVSSIVICNRGSATMFRISVAVGGAANDNKQYIFYDVSIGANTANAVVIGVTLGVGDVVRVYATLATLSFSLFGSEIT